MSSKANLPNNSRKDFDQTEFGDLPENPKADNDQKSRFNGNSGKQANEKATYKESNSDHDGLKPDNQQPAISRRKKSAKRRQKRIDNLFKDLDQFAPAAEPISSTPQITEEMEAANHSEVIPVSNRDHLKPSENQEEPIAMTNVNIDENTGIQQEREKETTQSPKPEINQITDSNKHSDAKQETQRAKLRSLSKSIGFQAVSSNNTDYRGNDDQNEEHMSDDQILPASSILTPVGWDSIKQSRLVVQNTSPEQPAAIAYALSLGDSSALSSTDQAADTAKDTESAAPNGVGAEQAALLLEILDDHQERQWSEDELILLEQVTDQLTLALENARLFEEARTRSTQLAILNEMSSSLSTQLNTDDVIQTTYHFTSQLLDTTNFYLALYIQETESISFPLVFENNQRLHWETRPLSDELTDYIIKIQKPLLIKSDFSHHDRELNVILDRDDAKSWLGVPMLYGNQVIGVIAVQSFRHEDLYDEDDLDMLNAVASQAAVALLNARLFEQTQSALDALEVSERYQKSVAQAVALLSERGMGALTEVLEILGKAAKASRAYYFETQVDHRGSYWRLIAEWHQPDVPAQLSNSNLKRLPTTRIQNWLNPLISKGSIAATVSGLPPETQLFFEEFGTRSILQFAVSGRHEIPGCIGFEQVDRDRAWGEDEVAALQTAASALANTLIREDLFTQVQINLADTEGLYKASARLNSAVTYDDILDVLRQHTSLGHINTSSVTLNVFDRPWEYNDAKQRDIAPEWLITLARWTSKPIGMDTLEQPVTADRYSLKSWPTMEKLLHPEKPTVVMDIASDPRIDDVGRSIYVDRMNAKSLIYVPLNVAGSWIGHIIGVYRQITGFPEQELRRLTSLAGQAAVAVQNQQSIDLATIRAQEAQQRSEELATLNQITAAANRTLNLDEMLAEVLKRLLNTIGFSSGLISIVNQSSQKLALFAHQNLPERMVNIIQQRGLDNTACDLVYKTKQTILIEDLENIPTQHPEWLHKIDVFSAPIAMGFHSYLGSPIESKGQVLGTVCLFNDVTHEVTSGQTSLITAVGQQLGVVVDNARLFQETRRRANQLQTAAEIARDTSSTLALDTLLQRTVEQMLDRFNYYHATIFLLDEEEQNAVVRESTGIAGEEMKHRRHKLAVGGQSVIGQATLTGEPLVVNDVTSEEGRKIHRPNPFLPETRAELGIPLKIGDQVIGALDVQATETDAFTNDDIAILQTLADQIAVAVDNARSYELAQKAVEEIREADRLKSQFLANMSHELRTPLNSIIGFSRVILKGIDGPINELQQQDLTAIYNSGQHLLGLINDVLDLSKIEAGKMDLAFEDDVNLSDIIKGVMSTTGGLVKDKPITLNQEIDPNIPLLRIDPMKIRQVLINLLSNASKFTQEGSITTKAELQVGSDGKSEVYIGVTDTGSGIAPDDQKKLFQPFSQVDGSLTRRMGGSGLGLSICHHLIRLHGGRIGLKSKVGEGSTFYFTLPLEGVAADTIEYDFGYQPELPDLQTVEIHQTNSNESSIQKSDSESQTEEGEGSADSAQLTTLQFSSEIDENTASPPIYTDSLPETVSHGLVLAIDEDPQIIGLYRRYLSDFGLTVIAVNEIDQALTVAQGVHPSIITLDISMKSDLETNTGKVDGWYVLRKLKENPSTKNIPVIICSLLDEKEKASKMGANDYLVKPILEIDLSTAIERILT